jgi:hypothetical protein
VKNSTTPHGGKLAGMLVSQAQLCHQCQNTLKGIVSSRLLHRQMARDDRLAKAAKRLKGNIFTDSQRDKSVKEMRKCPR